VSTSCLNNTHSLPQESSWTSSEHLPLSNTLLGILEDSAMYKTALGFDKGDVGSVPAGGKKVVDIYCEIVCKMFIDVPGSK